MKKEITVDKAIKRGHLIVNIPVFVVIFGIPTLGIYLSSISLIPVWIMGISFPMGFLTAWLTWSLMITKWRIWAFDNVTNVHDLKRRAIQEKLIWEDGNIFEKTEIRTNKEGEILNVLKTKFKKEDVYED